MIFKTLVSICQAALNAQACRENDIDFLFQTWHADHQIK